MCTINGMSQLHGTEVLAFDLTDRLHKSMRVAKLTTTTLGEALGVHRNTISNYLTGRSPMDRRTMISWAFATGVPLAWLETGIVPPSTGPGEGGNTSIVPKHVVLAAVA